MEPDGQLPRSQKLNNKLSECYNVAHLFHCSIITFQDNPQAHWHIFPLFWHKLKCSVTLEMWVLVYAIINKQPFPLPHFCRISHLQSVAGAAQTNSTFHVTATTRTTTLHRHGSHRLRYLNSGTRLAIVPAVQTKVTTTQLYLQWDAKNKIFR